MREATVTRLVRKREGLALITGSHYLLAAFRSQHGEWPLVGLGPSLSVLALLVAFGSLMLATLVVTVLRSAGSGMREGWWALGFLAAFFREATVDDPPFARPRLRRRCASRSPRSPAARRDACRRRAADREPGGSAGPRCG